jgi:hypothetical protein
MARDLVFSPIVSFLLNAEAFLMSLCLMQAFVCVNAKAHRLLQDSAPSTGNLSLDPSTSECSILKGRARSCGTVRAASA